MKVKPIYHKETQPELFMRRELVFKPQVKEHLLGRFQIKQHQTEARSGQEE